ncbi:MAG: DUF1801 domain-containing protein [Balneolaceae bacterium]|nr:DUF1801 domain-containing protein [Balneolaceae bacterium]
MGKSNARNVDEYLKTLQNERSETITAIRELILEHLPAGYRESINGDRISYEIPMEQYPDTYNGKPLEYVAVAARKNHIALYLMSIYMEPERKQWLKGQFTDAGKNLDMGKSCIRFKNVDDLPLEAIGELIAGTTPKQFIETYESIRSR